MKLHALSLAAASLLPTSLNAATAHVPHGNVQYAPDLARRAFAAVPSGYQPVSTPCPSNRPSLRNANGLSPQESSWLQQRRPQTVEPMRELLQRLNISGFDASGYISNNANNASNLPNIGIAASGGGYRALMNGAGALAAFDSRTPGSTGSGQLGGLLQSATYLAGLSGGGWLVGSLFADNFTSVQDIVNAGEANFEWDFQNSIFDGPDLGGSSVGDTLNYFNQIQDQVSSKQGKFNFNISITDYWGRALSYQLINAPAGGVNYTFSSIAAQDLFTNGSAPMPILVADSRAPGQKIISSNNTVFEFNPWEMGSWDPTVYGFAPMQYVGSNFTNGQLGDNESCIVGFDNYGYVMGTSSSLFNEGLLLVNTSSLPSFIQNALNDILNSLSTADNDIADWTPNPFYQFNPQSNPSASSDSLTLVDGGEDNQNLPLNPLIQPPRAVDVIFAIDSSADTNQNWPNGSSLVQTFQRTSNTSIQNGTAFPFIPPVETFINDGLNSRPAFFGCNASNTTSAATDPVPAPLIVYLPNAPYVFNSNVSTFTPTTNLTTRNAIIQNGYDVATQGNATLDSNWPTCVGCAMLQRTFARTNTRVPDACTRCFQQYCWNGSVNNTTPAPYLPTLKIPNQQVRVSGASKGFGANAWLAVTSAVSLMVVLAVV